MSALKDNAGEERIGVQRFASNQIESRVLKKQLCS